MLVCADDTQGWDVCGEMGVGGGSRGPSAAEVTEGESMVAGSWSGAGESMSGEDEESSASSSQESATGAAFFFLAAEGWVLDIVVVTVGRGMFLTGLWAMERSRREEWSSEVAAAEADIGARQR